MASRITVVTLVWTAIIALEEPFERYICPRLPSWLTFICRLYPYLRGPGEWPPEWRWWLKYPVGEGGYRFDIVPWRFLVLLAVVSLFVAWWVWTKHKSRLNVVHLSMLAGLGLCFVLTIQFLSKNGVVLMTRMISPYYEPTYFLPAAEIVDVRDFLITYPDCLQAMNCPTHHMNSHPPGNVLFMWIFYQIASALPDMVTEWLGPFLRAHTVAEWAVGLPDRTLIAAGFAGLAIPAVSVLTVIPLYYLGVETVGHSRARRVLILFLLVPAITMFAPRVDLVYTLLAVTGLWLALVGFVRRSYLALSGAGALLSLAAFMSFATLPLVLMAALLGLGLAWQTHGVSKQAAFTRLLPQFLVALGAAALVWIIFGTNPVQIYKYISSNYWGIQSARSHMAWIFYGPYDLLLFVGVPVSVLLVRAVLRLCRRIWGSRALTTGEVWLASFVISTGILFVSGRLRGEVARTLLYFYPFLVLGSYVESEQSSERSFVLISSATLVQAVIYYYTLRVYHGG